MKERCRPSIFAATPFAVFLLVATSASMPALGGASEGSVLSAAGLTSASGAVASSGGDGLSGPLSTSTLLQAISEHARAKDEPLSKSDRSALHEDAKAHIIALANEFQKKLVDPVTKAGKAVAQVAADAAAAVSAAGGGASPLANGTGFIQLNAKVSTQGARAGEEGGLSPAKAERLLGQRHSEARSRLSNKQETENTNFAFLAAERPAVAVQLQLPAGFTQQTAQEMPQAPAPVTAASAPTPAAFGAAPAAMPAAQPAVGLPAAYPAAAPPQVAVLVPSPEQRQQLQQVELARLAQVRQAILQQTQQLAAQAPQLSGYNMAGGAPAGVTGAGVMQVPQQGQQHLQDLQLQQRAIDAELEKLKALEEQVAAQEQRAAALLMNQPANLMGQQQAQALPPQASSPPQANSAPGVANPLLQSLVQPPQVLAAMPAPQAAAPAVAPQAFQGVLPQTISPPTPPAAPVAGEAAPAQPPAQEAQTETEPQQQEAAGTPVPSSPSSADVQEHGFVPPPLTFPAPPTADAAQKNAAGLHVLECQTDVAACKDNEKAVGKVKDYMNGLRATVDCACRQMLAVLVCKLIADQDELTSNGSAKLDAPEARLESCLPLGRGGDTPGDVPAADASRGDDRGGGLCDRGARAAPGGARKSFAGGAVGVAVQAERQPASFLETRARAKGNSSLGALTRAAQKAGVQVAQRLLRQVEQQRKIQADAVAAFADLIQAQPNAFSQASFLGQGAQEAVWMFASGPAEQCQQVETVIPVPLPVDTEERRMNKIHVQTPEDENQALSLVPPPTTA
ncbi:hypothetical protein BESB_044510 [Besnoitia besnoiti]|uniref:Uncharacterized protein n=1 Tax=Besnoitia besnoiti TaxID=94643 RepID=A0A2A9MEF7_BESBE|nr:hypothetical protein BESB_044510 [Besnoitia besnoiti]PFH36259.1 hypothetical protein BESB_044510 [Besnoitia besnoiti]